MSMNVNTTGTVYGSYQNTYKAGTVDKKKETAKTTEKKSSWQPPVFFLINILYCIFRKKTEAFSPQSLCFCRKSLRFRRPSRQRRG